MYKTQKGRKDILYLKYNREFYIYIKTPFHQLLLKDLKHIGYNKKLFYLIFAVMILIIFILYFIIIKKLLPIKHLIFNIQEFGKRKV